MKKTNNIINKKFNKLKPIQIVGKNKHGRKLYECLCDCGNTKVIDENSIKRGKTKSCGCLKKVSKDFQMVGKTFSMLTVLERLEKDEHKKYLYKCLCECGNQTVCNGNSLRSGNTKSCGCYKKIKTRKIDLKNKVFGYLKVLRFHEIKNKRTMWECVCLLDNNVCIINSHNLIKGRAKSCGCLKTSYLSSEISKYCKEKFEAKTEYRILKNPNTGMYLPYDVYIPKLKIFIEVNGQQHYKYVEHFHRNKDGFKNRIKIDKLKRSFASKNGIFLEINSNEVRTLEEFKIFLKNNLSKKIYNNLMKLHKADKEGR